MASERIQRRINKLLDEADGAVTALDWDIVRARAEAVLAFDPENTEAIAYQEATERAIDRIAPASSQTTSSPAPTATPDQPLSFADGRSIIARL